MFKKTYRPMMALVLAGVLSITASAVQASEGPGSIGDDNGRSHGSAAPICDGTGGSQKTASRLFRDWCRVLATDGPGGPGDDTGRTADRAHAYPVLVGDGGPSGAGENNGRTADVETTHPVLATEGAPGGANDNNGRSAALITGDWHPVLADDTGPISAGDHNGRAELVIDIHSMMAGGGKVGSDF
jgi:hypothetical protein